MTTRNGKKGSTTTKAPKAAGKGNGRKKAPTAQAGQTRNEPREPADVGTNRTGMGTAPARAARTTSGAQIEPAGDVKAFYKGHVDIIRSYEDGREPIGTMPPPTRLKGAVKMLADLVTGKKGNVLLDKLGERLAFERTGTRLYEQLIAKHDVHGSYDGGPSRADLESIREDERDHFELLTEVMVQLGADPTAVTPCADVASVESIGLQKVVGDPRTTLPQALHAIHVAELTDNDGWAMLIELVEGFNQREIADRFRVCRKKEQQHLERVRSWLVAYDAQVSGALAGAV